MQDTAVKPGEDRRGIEDAVTRYLRDVKKWHRGQYRIEHRDPAGNRKGAIVWAVWLEDEKAPAPGSGRSVELHVDLTRQQVVAELAFQ